MTLGTFTDLATLAGALSLAVERGIVVLKTIMPTWLADQRGGEAVTRSSAEEYWRRIGVLLLAFLLGTATAAWVANWTLTIRVGEGSVSVFLLGLMSCGGSAFWAQAVAYASAAKDVQTLTRAASQRAFDTAVADREPSGLSVPPGKIPSLAALPPVR